jgi:hypothetical protein
VTKPREADKPRPWEIYRKPDGSADKLYEPGWPGTLHDEEVERLQKALSTDPDLARFWGWKPSMKRRATAAVERVAAYGSPDDIALNRKLVREFSKKTLQGNESPAPRVKNAVNPRPPRMGRKKVEGWESEMLRLAGMGVGVHKIAKALQSQYRVAISGPTVAARLRELKGQLRLIS